MHSVIEEKIKRRIIADEGREERYYKDSLGNLTIGVGHLVEEGKKEPDEVIDFWFEKDYEWAKVCADGLFVDHSVVPAPWLEAIIINMTFNMGPGRVKKFRKMWEAIRDEDWDAAADEMLDSRWATQVGPRATRLAKNMRTQSLPL